jgi:phage gp36-like protein
MAFISAADFSAQIKPGILNQLIDNDSTILDAAIAMGEEELWSYLSPRFDADAVLAAIDPDRNAMVLNCAVDITLYHLHSRVTPNQVPGVRKDRYDAAIDWLKGVASGEINPRLPIRLFKDTNDQTPNFRMGSNQKFNTEY